MTEVERKCIKAKEASRSLAVLGTASKDKALMLMADLFEKQSGLLKSENARDLEAAKAAGIGSAMLKRLELTDKKINQMAP